MHFIFAELLRRQFISLNGQPQVHGSESSTAVLESIFSAALRNPRSVVKSSSSVIRMTSHPLEYLVGCPKAESCPQHISMILLGVLAISSLMAGSLRKPGTAPSTSVNSRSGLLPVQHSCKVGDALMNSS